LKGAASYIAENNNSIMSSIAAGNPLGKAMEFVKVMDESLAELE